MKQTLDLLPTESDETRFRFVSGLMKLDVKKRVSLGAVFSGSGGADTLYNIYKNTIGQIVLDPVRVIPESELWLFKNKAAFQSVERGVQQAAGGETEYIGAFSEFLGDPPKGTHAKKADVHPRGKGKPRRTGK
ncbi:MAG: hypothetical protein LBW77_04885 [Verrucomicrobiota bacterium]|jgi:hypothetical protein|nr:hypothetical protein [Verrucomicrobiota bacterium]